MRYLLNYVLISLLLFPSYSYATLGESTSSVQNDYMSTVNTEISMQHNNSLNATSKVRAYTINNKYNQIKEYSFNDKIFAIKWTGSGYPNFRQLLGKYTPQLKSGKQSKSDLNHKYITGEDFIYKSYGIPGHLSGVAHVPSLTPKNFNINSLD